MRAVLSVALLSTVILAGCGNPSSQLIGVPPSLQQSNLMAEQNLQDQMVEVLIRKAGHTLPEVKANPVLWRDVADAGLVEVDIQCDRYLAALFTFNREQRAGRQILTAAGAGTAAILGLTGAAGVTIALVAASFGLAASVFDAGVNSVLFTVSPTAIRAVAARGRQAYIESIRWDRVTSRPRMMMVVQGYLAQCTPAAIEANIDNAATGAPSVSNVGTAIRAAALASPASSVVQDPEVFIASPVAGPRVVPPAQTQTLIPQTNRPRNVTAAEAGFIQTKTDAEDLQRALGTAADGDLGPTGLAKPGPTREAIAEYHTGQLRRDDKKGQGSEVMDLDSYLLMRGRRLPDGVNSAFERALLGDRPTCTTIRRALIGLQVTTPPPNVTEECMKALRVAIAARRAQPGMPAPLGRADALDSKLFDAGPAPSADEFPRPPPAEPR